MKRRKIECKWVSISFPLDLWREVFDYSSFVDIYECITLSKVHSLLANEYMEKLLTEYYNSLPRLCFGVRKNNGVLFSKCCGRKNYVCKAHSFFPIMKYHEIHMEDFNNKLIFDFCEATKALKRPLKVLCSKPVYSTIFYDRVVGIENVENYTTKNPRWLQQVKPIKWTTRSDCFSVFRKHIYPEMKRQIVEYFKGDKCNRYSNCIRNWFCNHGQDDLYLHILKRVEMEMEKKKNKKKVLLHKN